MLKPLIERAVAACRNADQAAQRSDDAAERLVSAQAKGGYWLAPLDEASNSRATEAAALLIEAYVACQEAAGAARAVRLTAAAEEWRPFRLQEEARNLFLGAASAIAGG